MSTEHDTTTYEELPSGTTVKDLLKNISENLDAIKPEHAERVIKAAVFGTPPVTRKRPTGYAKLSNTPYYRENYAHELQVILDQMLLDKEPREARCDALGLKKTTIYAKITQAFYYLMDYLEDKREFLDDGITPNPAHEKYTKLFNKLDIHMRRKTGVTMEFYDSLAVDRPMTFNKVEATNKINTWREALNKFIDEAPMETKFDPKKISITQEDIDEIRASLTGIENIHIISLTTTRILLVKTKEKIV